MRLQTIHNITSPCERGSTKRQPLENERIGRTMSAVGNAVSVSLALDSILVGDLPPDGAPFEPVEGKGRRQLNLSAGATIAVAIAFLMLAMTLGTNLTQSAKENAVFGGEWWDTPLHLRHTMDLPMDTLRAQLPVNGTYEALPYEEHFIEVELPASEQDAGFPGDALMHVALWLPDVPEGEKIPVIMTIHPYYDFGGEGVVGDDS